MIKHVLLFKVKEELDGRNKAETIVEAKRLIESMNGKIPGLIKVEVGVDYSETPDSADMVLYSEFESREALQVYATHPAHTAILPFVKSIYTERRLIDYEI